MILFHCLIALAVAFYCHGLCPYSTYRYDPEWAHDPAKLQSPVPKCYIILHFEEIKYIREHIWHEAPNKSYEDGDGRHRVRSYPEALRMCALVPFLEGHQYTYLWRQEWRKIPGPDTPIRLPTPETEFHVQWLMRHFLVDYYHKSSWTNYRDQGRIWLDVKRNSSPLIKSFTATGPANQLGKADVLGECGYLFRAPKIKYSGQTGLYWLRCTDVPLDDNYKGYEKDLNINQVACEFDEPIDCDYNKTFPVCTLNADGKCVHRNVYHVNPHSPPPHPRFGIQCPHNFTTEYTCSTLWEKEWCTKNCTWGPWTPVSPCYIKMKDEKRYICDDDDPYGFVDQWRVIKANATYNGSCKGRNFRTRYCPCEGIVVTVSTVIIAIGVIGVFFMP